MNNALLIQADDWEGLFVNGKLVEEGHALNEGFSRTKYFIQISKKYNFDLEDMREAYVTDDGEDYLYDYGHFPVLLKDFEGMYEEN